MKQKKSGSRVFLLFLNFGQLNTTPTRPRQGVQQKKKDPPSLTPAHVHERNFEGYLLLINKKYPSVYIGVLQPAEIKFMRECQAKILIEKKEKKTFIKPYRNPKIKTTTVSSASAAATTNTP